MAVNVNSSTTQNAAESTISTGPLSTGPLSDDELRRMDMWWRAANYLSVGQIYLMGNPLLWEQLEPEHVKPRLLGHWAPALASISCTPT